MIRFLCLYCSILEKHWSLNSFALYLYIEASESSIRVQFEFESSGVVAETKYLCTRPVNRF